MVAQTHYKNEKGENRPLTCTKEERKFLDALFELRCENIDAGFDGISMHFKAQLVNGPTGHDISALFYKAIKSHNKTRGE